MAFVRKFRVTAGVMVACALVGGLCGLLALVPNAIVHPAAVDDLLLIEVAPFAFGFGAVLGALLGPPIAFSALRHVPLWRVLLEPAVGTVTGAFAAWLLAWANWAPGFPGVLVLPLLGMAIAAIRLRLAVRPTKRPTLGGL